VEGDLTGLAQVVSNLLDNPARYTPDRGRIALSLKREGGEAVTVVSATGVGIAADRQSEIFQLFAQVDNRLERAHDGLGIGLALMKQLTDLRAGSVEVLSDGPGKGGAFTMRLPVAAVLQEAAAVADARATTTKPLKVRVVDDNEAVARTVGWMLEAIGRDYRLVHSGATLCRRRGNSAPMSYCSTSASPTWTATLSAARCDRTTISRRRRSLPRRAGAKRAIRRGPRRPGSIIASSSPSRAQLERLLSGTGKN